MSSPERSRSPRLSPSSPGSGPRPATPDPSLGLRPTGGSSRSGVSRWRAGIVYLLVGLVGAGAFLYPFWLPSTALPNQAHTGDAPLIAAVVGLLAVAAVTLEVRRGTMNGSTVALLGVLSATAGLLKLLDLPGGGSGIFFLVVLAGAAFGPRFGLLLGLSSFVVAAVLSGGIGPWLPFQMLALAWMGAGAGVVGRLTGRLAPWLEVAVLAAYAWAWGFVFGAIMNLWFWPFVRDGGPLSWEPGLGLGATLHHYWSFYVATSFAWDAAGALANAVVIAAVGRPILRTLRRFAHRLEPVVILDAAAFALPTPANPELDC
ncbi:MAG: putative rane protein [Acidimicrobiales bacterium]|nr:putative rane protein [Acidimicrobiales bacterium]